MNLIRIQLKSQPHSSFGSISTKLGIFYGDRYLEYYIWVTRTWLYPARLSVQRSEFTNKLSFRQFFTKNSTVQFRVRVISVDTNYASIGLCTFVRQQL
ncbi:hypothetical protein PUN28_014529 [Cardiocondyla obscurior]|uniref:Uncharacterized protein n=1 Tax=Cardiocondyla obscurior TaxID=286306 RepID=A0AAW2F0N2_9HYME